MGHGMMTAVSVGSGSSVIGFPIALLGYVASWPVVGFPRFRVWTEVVGVFWV